eukprot:m.158788 g.158788  ORF g.158788 m.158788 type:complete len:107 (+) comp17981_c1_seq1:511-831(+)
MRQFAWCGGSPRVVTATVAVLITGISDNHMLHPFANRIVYMDDREINVMEEKQRLRYITHDGSQTTKKADEPRTAHCTAVHQQTRMERADVQFQRISRYGVIDRWE